jgi:ribosome-associated protein
MIRITPEIAIRASEIQEEFVRSPGPGGQNVNKVATGVELRFDVRGSPSLPEEVRDRLLRLAGSRLTGDGVLVIQARRFRSQARNREDALDRLADLIRQASQRPRARFKTRPPARVAERRLKGKVRRGQTKQFRRRVDPGREDSP